MYKASTFSSLNWSSRRFKRFKRPQTRFVCKTDINSKRKCGFRTVPLFKRRPRNLEAEDVGVDVDFELSNTYDLFQQPWTGEDVDYVDVDYSDDVSWN